MKEAVAAAQRYLNELYEEASDVRLEEVERTEQYPQNRDWLITLSFGLPKVDRPLDPTIAYTQIFGTSSRLPRHYKVVPDRC